MTVSMRKGWVVAGIAALVLLLLGYAWIDGGREPLRLISQSVPVPVPVPVPEATR